MFTCMSPEPVQGWVTITILPCMEEELTKPQPSFKKYGQLMVPQESV